MERRRAYTILILGSGAQMVRRIRVTRRAMVGAIAGTLSLSTLGVACGLILPPLAVAWFALHGRVDALEFKNRSLELERQRMEGRMAEVGDKLALFEANAVKLSALAEASGVRPPRLSTGGPPARMDLRAADPAQQMTELARRSESLEQRFEAIEETLLSRADKLTTLPLLRPVVGTLSDGFGWRVSPFSNGSEFHQGQDILAPYGTPVKAPGEGTVAHAGYMSGYGLSVFIDLPSGLQARLAHLSRMAVRTGEHVAAGQVIGAVGSSGRSAGPHLHYEILAHGARVDPLRYLRAVRVPASFAPAAN